MKCVCGYETDKEKFIEVKISYYTGPDSHFATKHPDSYYTYAREVYACPKCGTLKIEVEK